MDVVSDDVDVMATLIFRRAICYGISALVPEDASMSFDLVVVDIDRVLRLLDVVYSGFSSLACSLCRFIRCG